MIRKVLLSIIIIALVGVFTGCATVTSTRTADSDSKDVSSDIAVSNTVSDDSQTSGIDSSMYWNKDTITEMEAYKKVLQNKAEFFSTEDNIQVLLKDYDFGYAEKMVATHFTIIDMDGDKIPEIVLKVGLMDSTNPYVGYEVFHYENGTVYSYTFGYRAMEELKKDGTFSTSSGALDNDISKLTFSSKTYKKEVLASVESGTGIESSAEMSYYIDNKPVTEELWNAFCDKQSEKEDVVWYDFTDRNIEIKFTQNG